jgi:hypothetical protein
MVESRILGPDVMTIKPKEVFISKHGIYPEARDDRII